MEVLDGKWFYVERLGWVEMEDMAPWGLTAQAKAFGLETKGQACGPGPDRALRAWWGGDWRAGPAVGKADELAGARAPGGAGGGTLFCY